MLIDSTTNRVSFSKNDPEVHEDYARCLTAQ